MKKNLLLTFWLKIPKIFIVTITLLSSVNTFAQSSWVQVPSPDTSATRNMVRGISGTSSSDIWAIGSFEETYPVIPYTREKDLMMHWNGNNWQIFPPMDLSTTLDDLWDVESLSPTNVWAVGAYNDFADTRGELLHYDGSAWSNYPLPFITGGSYLFSIDAISASDIWAAGGKAGSPTRPPYVIHYNGVTWSEIPVPSVGIFRNVFNAIDGISSSDVWAVGHWGNAYGDFNSLAMHWDGNNWINSPLPASVTAQQGEISNITMVSSNDVWAVGFYLNGLLFKLHWDGSTWAEVTNPAGGGGAYAVLSANNIYSVGGEISHWDGTTWTDVDTLSQLSYPSLVNAVTFSNGEIWVCGRTVDSANNFFSLIYRNINANPFFVRGNNQNWFANAGTTNTIDSLLIVQDADISQILTFTIVQAPAHGSLNGFPFNATTNNGFANSSGITYTPVAGYLGTDQFIIRAGVGQVFTETVINVNVVSVLPVTLVDFSLIKLNAAVLVKWATASESNTEKFEIEKSIDGINFSSIASVAAKGNSATVSQYNTTDHLPVSGLNYYRLKLIDKDGRIIRYSVQIIKFENNAIHQLIISPNPLLGREINLNVNGNSGNFTLNIYDQNGRHIYTRKIIMTTAGVKVLLPETLNPGVYKIVLQSDKETLTQNVIVH